MWRYIVCVGVCAVIIWIIDVRLMTRGRKEILYGLCRSRMASMMLLIRLTSTAARQDGLLLNPENCDSSSLLQGGTAQ